MTILSVNQYLAALEANPPIAAEFTAATPGKTRREAVQACHTLATNTLAEIEVNKRKLVVAKAKIAALEAARKSQPMKTTPLPTKAPTITASHTAASFATPAVTMTRCEFDQLTAQDKGRFFKIGGKLV
jgi:hypothetical protein